MSVALQGLWLVLCVAEDAGIEPAHRFPDDGLASRCLTTRPIFPGLAEPEGIEPSPIPERPGVQAPFVPCTPGSVNLAPRERLELPSSVLETDVLPLDERDTSGCPGRHRTYAHRLNRAALYRLSYRTKIFRGLVVGVEGIEPSRLLVNGFTVRRASPSAPHPHERGFNNSRMSYCAKSLNWSG